MATYSNTREGTRGRRVFVTRIPPYTNYKELLKLFKAHQPEHAVVVKKPRSTYGFLTFPNATLAADAVKWVTTTRPTFHKKRIVAEIADPWQENRLIRPRDRPNPFPGWEPPTSPPLTIDIIARIARYLGFADRARLECVNRLWRQGAMASYATIRQLDTEDWRWPSGWEQRIITTEALNWAVRRLGPYVTDLRLDGGRMSERLRPQVIGVAMRNCPHLQSLDLSGVRVRPSAMRDILPTASNLRVLKLGFCQPNIEPELSALFGAAVQLRTFVASTTEFAGASLARMNPTLGELRLRNCGTLLAGPLAAALALMRSLTVLELNQCRSVTTEEPLQALLDNQSLHGTLEELRVVDMDFAPPVPDEEDVDLRPIGLNNPVYIELQVGPAERASTIPELFQQLRHLSMVFSGWVDNAFVIHIGQHLNHLEHLDLSGCSNIRGQFSLEPLATLPKLRSFYFHNMHPSVGAQVLGSIATLEEVRCRDSQGVNDEDTTGAVQGCPNLTTLDVEGCLGVTQQTLHGITEFVRLQGRTAPLELWVGGTSVDRRVRVRPSLIVRIQYDRVYQPIMREFLG